MFDHYLADDQARREALSQDFAEWYEEIARLEEDERWYLPENTEFSNDSW